VPAAGACILGCAGPRLSDEERVFFREARPAGLILFARNCETPDQVAALTAAYRDAVGTEDTLVLIDQEGGRVQRLRPPHWTSLPAAERFGALYATDPEAAIDAARSCGRLIAGELSPLGITMCCAPVLDLRVSGAHAVIGDRAYGSDPAHVSVLGRAMAEGLLAGGVLPVVKHIPGHGRALADSHEHLPSVDAPREVLESNDIVPFKALADLPAAMTGHVVYPAWDARHCATESLAVVQNVVRGLIGFDGLLMTDDLSMKALSGTYAERTDRALLAGCDVALHCNGDLDEMREVASAAGSMGLDARLRYARCLALLGARHPFDAAAARARLAALA
jgi:beta-N-acetylhexosaminidase